MEATMQHEEQLKAVEITVNGKTVKVRGPKQTGLEIKKAAIAQQVSIQLDFILSEEIGDRRTLPTRSDALLV
jgi:Multiubiquitin